MRVIQTVNVNRAWSAGLQLLAYSAQEEDSRIGKVLVVDSPVTTVYSRPTERVLFCERRDANPFFHLFESMWMLMGRNDPQWLDRYVSDFSARFAEFEDGRMHGAYGHRWRRTFPALWHERASSDQLQVLAELLRRDPGTRQAVLTMWSPQIDLLAPTRDKPCNTHCYFRRRDDRLDMTILCRSNDMIWGTYGANAVHMSVMLEYVATMAGCRVGMMYQVSNNYHAYVDVLDKIFGEIGTAVSSRDKLMQWQVPDCDHYATGKVAASPLFADVTDWLHFQEELCAWGEHRSTDPQVWTYSILRDLLVPMSRTHDLVVAKNWRGAMSTASTIQHSDWRLACQQWIGRRLTRAEARVAQESGT